MPIIQAIHDQAAVAIVRDETEHWLLIHPFDAGLRFACDHSQADYVQRRAGLAQLGARCDAMETAVDFLRKRIARRYPTLANERDAQAHATTQQMLPSATQMLELFATIQEGLADHADLLGQLYAITRLYDLPLVQADKALLAKAQACLEACQSMMLRKMLKPDLAQWVCGRIAIASVTTRAQDLQKIARAIRWVARTSWINDHDIFRYAYCLPDDDDHETAVWAYTQFIAKKPDLAVGYMNRANRYDDLGLLDKALADYNYAIKLEPNNVSSYHNRGSLYDREGNYDAALRDFDKAIALNPQFAPAYNNRAYTLLRIGAYPEAFADIQKCIGLGNALACDFATLAEIESAMGDHENFYLHLLHALDMDPGELRKLDASTIARHQDEPRFQALQAQYGGR